MIIKIIAILGVLACAFALVALGMAIATKYNRIAWDKYYEGASISNAGVKPPHPTRAGGPR